MEKNPQLSLFERDIQHHWYDYRNIFLNFLTDMSKEQNEKRRKNFF